MPFTEQPKFDVAKEAEKMENLAKERLDTKNDFHMNPTAEGLAASKKLGDEWGSLNPEERKSVAHELSEKYHNRKFDTLPIPVLMENPQGEIIGVEFYASHLDFHLGPDKVAVGAAEGLVLVGQEVPSFSADVKYSREYEHNDLYSSAKK